MINRILFIIPYFGRFNNYFQLWLQSCKYNPTINWLILTDDKTAYDYPSNVHVVYTTFQEVVRQFQNCFDFPIELTQPYQLCEFKVAYGEAFANYAAGYDFWGHCDVDVIWGNLRRHLTDDILKSFSKISWRGHLTLYKNTDRINKLYRTPIEGVSFYKYAFSNPTGFPLAPDERAINFLYEMEGEKIYKDLMFADLKIRSYNFELLHFPKEENYKNRHQIFLWDNGNLQRLYTYNGVVHKEDFAYIHFLKRNMKLPKDLAIANRFLIVPNRFLNIDGEVTYALVQKLSEQRVYWSYLLERLNPAYVSSKIKYRRSKELFKKKFGFVPMRTVRLKLPAYRSPQ